MSQLKTLLFASNNRHKAAEIAQVLGDRFCILTLADAGININIPEPHDSFHKNALEKSSTITRITGKNCFSEDSGLEVMALGGAPGVSSARYAHENATDAENITHLLRNLEGVTNRNAQFKTVISLQYEGASYFFEGTCSGKIIEEPRGNRGFGYDPIFVPDGDNRSFGEMSMEEKSKFSHRKKAVEQLVNFLQNRFS
ncbi:MAG: RdgB/HAM1 family non-canonical purine NTP pyrophosphatase [Sediminibacterium sp.]|nr:RdgB/HAM1 family non-canonical purine NTP pyrophosphatase [Sediminibacterium sp.]